MTAPLLSKNEEIYPSCSIFNPDRFPENLRLDTYQLTFSRESRRYIGISATITLSIILEHWLFLVQINLAYSELYLMLAGILRKYDLYDSTRKRTLSDFGTVRDGKRGFKYGVHGVRVNA